MTAATKQLDALKSRFENLQTRERWLVMVATAVLLLLVVDGFLISPMQKTLSLRQTTLASTRADIDKAFSEATVLEAASLTGPASAKSREKKALQQQITFTENELTKLTGGLVKAETLPAVLEDILVHTGNLELQSLVSEEPEAQLSGLYKHQVILQLTGSYFDVLAYLKALETSPWNFYWESLDYRVDQYPYAEVEIRVYTLSSDTRTLDKSALDKITLSKGDLIKGNLIKWTLS